jgi:hypothetical protein
MPQDVIYVLGYKILSYMVYSLNLILNNIPVLIASISPNYYIFQNNEKYLEKILNTLSIQNRQVSSVRKIH